MLWATPELTPNPTARKWIAWRSSLPRKRVGSPSPAVLWCGPTAFTRHWLVAVFGSPLVAVPNHENTTWPLFGPPAIVGKTFALSSGGLTAAGALHVLPPSVEVNSHRFVLGWPAFVMPPVST